MAERNLIRALLLIVSFALVASGCDRPFREVEPPAISVVEPDLSEVLPSPEVILKVSTESFREVERVELNGAVVHYDSTTGLWTDTLYLSSGVTALVLRAYDEQDAVRTDTVYAVYADVSSTTLSRALPAPRGGHTATLLDDGRVLIAGGATRALGEGETDVFLFALDGSSETLLEGLAAGRVGHTATRLPDGRVLIAGGSEWGSVESLADLVELVELFDPATRSFRPVPVVGEPIRRAYHSAVAYQDGDDVLIDVFGGRGDVSYGGSGSLGTRRDLRTYLFRRDTLFQQTSAIGGILLEPLSGHTQTSLTGAITRSGEQSLLLGSRFSGNQYETVSLRIDYTTGGTARVFDAPPLLTPRTQHAAVTLRTGAVLVFGGRQETAAAPVTRSELYIHELNTFFRLRNGVLGYNVFGHAATKLPDGRILVTGGFGIDSDAFPEVSVVRARF